MPCKNCNTDLQNTQKYCFECGAKVINNRLTLKNIFEDINNQFLNYDNKFIKTFLFLFTKPEEVILSFINGTRKKYINVIQYFAISLTLVGFQIFLINNFFNDAIGLDEIYGDAFSKFEHQENNPFSPSNFDYAQINNYQSLIYILTVPFSAIATWIAYFITGYRKFNFTEHVVLNLYYSAQIIIISAVFTIVFLCFGVSFMLITSIITLLTFAYFFYVLKRIFNTKFLDTLGVFLLVMLVILAFFLALIFLVAIIGIIIAIKKG